MSKEALRVLVIDDEADFLDLMTNWINYLGYQTLTTQDPKEAIEMVRSDKVDIALVDYRMPQMTGSEVIHKIREFNESIPLIMITAFYHEAIGQKSQGLNISMIMSKQRLVKQDLEHILHVAKKAIEQQKKEAAKKKPQGN